MKTLYYQQLNYELPILILTAKNLSTSEHKHSFFELAYVASGKAEHTLDGNSGILKKGDFFLIDLNSSHEYKKTADSSELRIINCIFLPEFIDESLHAAKSFKDITDRQFINHGAVSEDLTKQIFHDDSGMIGKLFKNMQTEFDEKKTGFEDVIKNHLQTVLIHILRNNTAKVSESNVIQLVKEHVAKNYMRSLKLSDICEKMNFSLSYISMKFKKDTGMTFREYLLKVRIEKACFLLRNSNMTVNNIAGTVGYTEPAFFYKTFRKEIGLTPDDYRKKHMAK